MMQSEQINELATALAAAQGEFPVLEKKSKAYNYNYADLAETLQATQGPLTKHGLSVVHQICMSEGAEMLNTKVLHSSGQWIGTQIPLLHRADGKVNPMQALGSAITYAKRYAIGCLLNLAADKEIDDDGEKSAPKGTAHKVAVKPNLPKLMPDQVDVIEKYLEEFPDARKDLLAKFKTNDIRQIPFDRFNYIVTVFENKRKAVSE